MEAPFPLRMSADAQGFLLVSEGHVLLVLVDYGNSVVKRIRVHKRQYRPKDLISTGVSSSMRSNPSSSPLSLPSTPPPRVRFLQPYNSLISTHIRCTLHHSRPDEVPLRVIIHCQSSSVQMNDPAFSLD